MSYTDFHRILPFLLIIQRVRNADINRSAQWTVKLKKGTFDENRYRISLFLFSGRSCEEMTCSQVIAVDLQSMHALI
jgi:hypothetical protein